MEIINIFNDIKRLEEIKKIIVKKLLETNELSEDIDIYQFIKYINLQKYIYSDNIDNSEEKAIIPFNIININKDKYVLYASKYDDNTNKKLLDKLKVINYDTSNLSKVKIEELYYNDKLDDYKFIINSEIYRIK